MTLSAAFVSAAFKFALQWILERLVEIDCVEARTDGNTRFYRLRHTPWQPDLENLRAVGSTN